MRFDLGVLSTPVFWGTPMPSQATQQRNTQVHRPRRLFFSFFGFAQYQHTTRTDRPTVQGAFDAALFVITARRLAARQFAKAKVPATEFGGFLLSCALPLNPAPEQPHSTSRAPSSSSPRPNRVRQHLPLSPNKPNSGKQ